MARPRQPTPKQSPVEAPSRATFAKFNAVAWAIVGAISAIVLLAVAVPWQPIDESVVGALDYSWMLVMHDALATGRQFGRDIVFMYGPLGFIVTAVYDPRTFLILLTVRSLMALAAFFALWSAARKFLRHPLVALPWALAIIVVLGTSPDHFFPMCAVLLLASYFLVSERRVNGVVIALTLVLAAASLAKINLLLQAVVTVGAISLDQAIRRPRFFFATPLIFAGGIAAFYLAARQHPANFFAFLHTSVQVSAAYVDAVGLPGPFIDALAYLIAAALALVIIADAHWQRQRIAGMIPTAALAALLLLLYKHSFVRQDVAHATIGPLVLFGVTVLYLPAAWPSSNARLRQALCIAAVGLAGIVASSSLSAYTGKNILQSASAAGERTLGVFSSIAMNVSHPSQLRAQLEQSRAQIRHDAGVPIAEIRGSVDVYPHRPDVIFAYDFSYNPRPSILSVVATSPELAELNARHLQGAAAPDSILFDIDPVDHNYPAMLDGWSWPDLLTRYDLVDDAGAFLILRRAPAPRQYQLAPLVTLTGQFDKPLPIPDAAPLWARIHLTPRKTGKVIAALYRPPVLIITARTRDGTENEYRLLPALAAHGFLLSPLVKTRGDFARFSGPTWQKYLQPASIDSITISVGDASVETYFDAEFTVELERFEFPHEAAHRAR